MHFKHMTKMNVINDTQNCKFDLKYTDKQKKCDKFGNKILQKCFRSFPKLAHFLMRQFGIIENMKVFLMIPKLSHLFCSS